MVYLQFETNLGSQLFTGHFRHFIRTQVKMKNLRQGKNRFLLIRESITLHIYESILTHNSKRKEDKIFRPPGFELWSPMCQLVATAI